MRKLILCAVAFLMFSSIVHTQTYAGGFYAETKTSSGNLASMFGKNEAGENNGTRLVNPSAALEIGWLGAIPAVSWLKYDIGVDFLSDFRNVENKFGKFWASLYITTYWRSRFRSDGLMENDIYWYKLKFDGWNNYIDFSSRINYKWSEMHKWQSMFAARFLDIQHYYKFGGDKSHLIRSRVRVGASDFDFEKDPVQIFAQIRYQKDFINRFMVYAETEVTFKDLGEDDQFSTKAKAGTGGVDWGATIGIRATFDMYVGVGGGASADW